MKPEDPAFDAGYRFVKKLSDAKGRTDASDGVAPLWHGWAVREAFWAGVEWERERSMEPREEKESGSEEEGADPFQQLLILLGYWNPTVSATGRDVVLRFDNDEQAKEFYFSVLAVKNAHSQPPPDEKP